jgi:tetratricopeptide (TPR) repeat protein
VAPVGVLAVVLVAVWYFVFRESADERGARLITEARTALDAGDVATAESRIREALDSTPRNGVLLHNLGVLELRQGRLAEARQAFEGALAAHGPQASEVAAEELFQLASISYEEKKWEQAASELERAIAAAPARAQLHARLLDLQLGPLAAPHVADSTTSRWLRLCGGTPRNLGDAAFIHYQHESFAAAEALSRQAVALEDSFVDGHAMMARAARQQGRAVQALADLEGPLARYPRSASLWVARSLILVDLDRRQQALDAADRAVTLAPRSLEAHQARQKALSMLGRLPEAAREIDIARSLTTDPREQRLLLEQQRILYGMIRMSGAAADSTPATP